MLAAGRFQVGAESVASPLSLTPLVIIFEFAARRALAGRWPVSFLPPAGHARAAGIFKLALSQSLAPLTAVASSLSRSLPQSLFSSWPPGGRLWDASRFQVCRQPGTRGPLAGFKFAASLARAGRGPVSSWRSVSGFASLPHSLSHYFRVCRQSVTCWPRAFQVCCQPGSCGQGAGFKLGLSQWLRLSLSLPQSLFSSLPPVSHVRAASRSRAERRDRPRYCLV